MILISVQYLLPTGEGHVSTLMSANSCFHDQMSVFSENLHRWDFIGDISLTASDTISYMI